MVDRFASLGKFIDKKIEEYDLPSIVAGVLEDREVVFREARGLADIDAGRPTTTAIPYSVASVTKPFVGSLLAIFAERGKLDLSHPASEYLPSGSISPVEGSLSQVTLARIANHTSGLPTHFQFFFGDEEYRPPAFEETMRRYANIVFPPGERCNYSNLGYGILGHILEASSGTTLGDLLHTEIFQPLKLDNALFAPAGKEFERCAVRYDANAQPLPNYVTDHPGASELFISLDDLLKFAGWHLELLRGPELSASGLRRMREPFSSSESEASYGLSWGRVIAVSGEKFVSHTGSMPGVSSQLVVMPERGVAIAVLSNLESNAVFEIVQEICCLLDMPLRKQPASKLAIYPPEQLRGVWKGRATTYHGDYSLELRLDRDGDDAIVCGESAPRDLFYADQAVKGAIDVEIEVPDAARTPHRLELDLLHRQDGLRGAVMARSLPGQRTSMALSFPASLDWSAPRE